MTEMKPRISPQDLLDALNARYATKAFDKTRKIDAQTWLALEEALILTPSSWGFQPWKFVIVTDQAVKEELLPHAWNQGQIVDCSHLVVFCTQQLLSDEDTTKLIGLTAQLNGIPAESLSGYAQMLNASVAARHGEQMLNWNARQVYLAVEQLLFSCALLGIDACPMEGFMAEKFDEVLQIDGYTATVIVPVGYRAPDDKYASRTKVRYSREDLIVRK